jgi:GNAT superfamily N-acetyltransferase
MAIAIVHRKPSVAEFKSVVASVGFREHDDPAVEIALANSLSCICAVEEQQVVGIGRVAGDGAISFLLTGVMVRPSHQRCGIGTLIVQALGNAVEGLGYKNMMMEAVPQPHDLPPLRPSIFASVEVLNCRRDYHKDPERQLCCL